MTNSQIIDFALAREARAKPPPAPVTVELACSALLRDLEVQADHLCSRILGIQDGLTTLSETCSRLYDECGQTVAFCDQCLNACELTDLDALEEARARLTAAWKVRFPDSTNLSAVGL